jgi:nucleoside-diphosphate-sugar epimerase
MKSSESRSVNLGNPVEHTVLEIAQMIMEVSGSESKMVFEPLPDDPKRRCPQIARAREVLGWEPRVGVREGLQRTSSYFAQLAERQEASSRR